MRSRADRSGSELKDFICDRGEWTLAAGGRGKSKGTFSVVFGVRLVSEDFRFAVARALRGKRI